MEPLDDLLKKSVERFGLEGVYSAGELVEKWPNIVGKQLAEKTAPLMFKDRVLLVRTANPGWSHHLALLKPALLERLRAEEYTVDDLRFICKEEDETVPKPTLKSVSWTKNTKAGEGREKPKLREAIDSYLRAREDAAKNGPNA